MYALGLPVLRRRKSSFIHGAEDDARELVDHLADSCVGKLIRRGVCRWNGERRLGCPGLSACMFRSRMTSLSGGRQRRSRRRSSAQKLWLVAAFLVGFITVLALYVRL